MRRILGLACVIFGIAAIIDTAPARAAANNVALAGRVTSAAEGPMEGVVVSAKQPSGTVTVSVVTDHDGRYSFPATRLAPGHYFIDARADGYELDGRGVTDVAAGKTTTDDLALRKAGNLAAQLNDAEWLMSIPGTEQQKKSLLNCNGCHTLQRIVQSTHTPEEWMPLFDPHGEILSLLHAVAAAGDGAPAAWRAAPAGAPGDVEISRQHQSQHQVKLGLSAEDDAARDRRRDACHRDRICPAAAVDRAA
jgi:hypothetical protein